MKHKKGIIINYSSNNHNTTLLGFGKEILSKIIKDNNYHFESNEMIIINKKDIVVGLVMPNNEFLIKENEKCFEGTFITMSNYDKLSKNIRNLVSKTELYKLLNKE